jgi:hypothetical protein
MLASLITLSQIALLAQSADPKFNSECLSPARNTCTFYTDCLESLYHCGPDGYPLGYGLHFCQKFSAESPRFSTKGQHWLSNTMLCLQRSLIPEATDPIATTGVRTCKELKDTAFSKHGGCYVECGLCQLSPLDWWVVVSTVGIRPILSFEGLGQAVEAVSLCVGWYSLLAVLLAMGFVFVGGGAYL